MSERRLPDFARSRALLIGVSIFDHPNLDNMPGVAGNIAALREVLTDTERSGFPDQNVEVVSDPEIPADVMTPAMSVSHAAEDVLLFYVATHGLLMGDNGELYLALRNTRSREPWTGLQFAHLANALHQSRAATKLLILDCCYSGRAPKHLMTNPEALIEDQTAVDGVYVMTATSGTKRAKAPRGMPYTAFSGLLIEAMNEGVPGAGKLIGMHQLFSAVLRATRSHPNWPLPQEYRKNHAENIALVKNAAAAAPAVSPIIATPTLDHSRSRAVLVGVQDYDDHRFNQLMSPERDLQLMDDCVRDSEIFGLKPDHCTVLLNPANRDDILSAISAAANEAEDMLLLYYTGHAYRDARGEPFLLPQQFSPDRPWTGVSSHDLAQVLSTCRARASIALVDACYGHSVAVAFQNLRESIVISASGRHELAIERDGHAVFTRSMVEVFTRGIADGPPHLSAVDLMSELDRYRDEAAPRPRLSAFAVTAPCCLFRNRSTETNWLRPHTCLMTE